MRERLDRQTVVREAAALADRHGFAALSLSELAARLRIKTPSLYNHVAGLDDLKRELQIEAARELRARFLEACAGRSGEAAVRALGEAYRRFARERPGLYPALTVAPDKHDRDAQAAAAGVVDVIATVLSAWGLAGDDAIHAVRVLRAGLHGFVSIELAGGFGLPVDVDETFARLLDTLVRGLRKK
jgi:AcrR family transcriptional regulator